MKRKLAAILTGLALACGVYAVEATVQPAPAQAESVQYNYGGPMCNWAGPWDGVYWRWSPYYGVSYIYAYSSGGWRYYRISNGQTWARPISCGR